MPRPPTRGPGKIAVKDWEIYAEYTSGETTLVGVTTSYQATERDAVQAAYTLLTETQQGDVAWLQVPTPAKTRTVAVLG